MDVGQGGVYLYAAFDSRPKDGVIKEGLHFGLVGMLSLDRRLELLQLLEVFP